MSIEPQNFEERLSKLESIHKKNKINQTILPLLFISILIFMGFSYAFFNDNIGHFVEEKILLEDRNGSIVTSLKPIETREDNGTKIYLRDSTPIYYSLFALLAFILIVIPFTHRKYSDIEHEE